MLSEDLHLRKFFNISQQFWIALVPSCNGISGDLIELGDWFKHTLNLRKLSRPSADLVFTIIGAKRTNNTTPASIAAASPAPFLLYSLRVDVFLDDIILLIISWPRFWWKIFGLCWLFDYKGAHCLALLQPAVFSAIFRDRPLFATVQSWSCSSLMAYCA